MGYLLFMYLTTEVCGGWSLCIIPKNQIKIWFLFKTGISKRNCIIKGIFWSFLLPEVQVSKIPTYTSLMSSHKAWMSHYKRWTGMAGINHLQCWIYYAHRIKEERAEEWRTTNRRWLGIDQKSSESTKKTPFQNMQESTQFPIFD